MGAKHAKWFVTSAKTTGWLRETELVPKTQGIVESIKQAKFALGLARVGKVPLPFPPHVAKDVSESRRLHELLHEQDRAATPGSSRARPRSRSSPTAPRRRARSVRAGLVPEAVPAVTTIGNGQ